MYRILKDFTGSPDGITSKAFTAGESMDIPEHLAVVALQAGWIASDASGQLTEAHEPAALAEDRESKVDEPTETKVEEATEKKLSKKKR